MRGEERTEVRRLRKERGRTREKADRNKEGRGKDGKGQGGRSKGGEGENNNIIILPYPIKGFYSTELHPGTHQATHTGDTQQKPTSTKYKISSTNCAIYIAPPF